MKCMLCGSCGVYWKDLHKIYTSAYSYCPDCKRENCHIDEQKNETEEEE